MKLKVLSFLIPLVLLVSCKTNKNDDKEAWVGIENSSSWLDFSGFIQTHPQSEYFDTALKSYFYHRQKYWDSIPPPPVCCLRNCAKIKVKNQNIIFELDEILIDSLQKQALGFIENKSRTFDGPSVKEIELAEGNNKAKFLSKGTFEISYHPSSLKNKEELQEVVIEVCKAIEDYKKQLAVDWFDTRLDELSLERRKLMDSLLAHRLVFYETIFDVPPPPPEP
jgi:hypothetical protein